MSVNVNVTITITVTTPAIDQLKALAHGLR